MRSSAGDGGHRNSCSNNFSWSCRVDSREIDVTSLTEDGTEDEAKVNRPTFVFVDREQLLTRRVIMV